MLSRRSVLIAGTTLSLATLLPRSARTQSADDPLSAAETLSQFEVNGQIDFLCNFMHSDSLREVPRYAVYRWYREEFLPSGPSSAVSTGVRYVDWTWAVNGMTYPGTAEVSYSQAFADGSVIQDVVRLVWQDGRWCWFFGRSREFISEQIDLGRLDVYPATQSAPPFWAEELASQSPDALAGLPQRFDGGDQSERFPITLGVGDRFWAAGEQIAVRYVEDRFTVAQASWLRLAPDAGFQVDFIAEQLEFLSRLPGFSVTAYDLLFRSDRHHALIRVMIDDALGPVSFHFIAGVDRSVWVLNARSDERIEDLGELLIQGAA